MFIDAHIVGVYSSVRGKIVGYKENNQKKNIVYVLYVHKKDLALLDVK